MLPVSADVIRLFLHVTAATIWVGGQLTLVGLLPALRAAGADVPRMVARRFSVIAWPAFGVLLLTGVWNLLAEDDDETGYAATLGLKMVVVLVSGAAAFLHARAKARSQIALWGALSGTSALAALFLGVLLTSH